MIIPRKEGQACSSVTEVIALCTIDPAFTVIAHDLGLLNVRDWIIFDMDDNA